MRTDGIEEAEFKHLATQFGGVIPELKVLSEKLKDKVAIIFTDAPVFELKGKIEANKIPTEARVGVVSPVDFTVPAGPTGLDPSQINFFHALNISTKIVKGQIEITKDFRVTTIGKKIKASEAALLKKLNIKPFEYGMKINCVYDDGAIVPQEVINIDPAQLVTKFQLGIRNLAGLSLAAGYPIEATVPLIISNSFRNIAALSLESGYNISYFRFKIKELDLLASSGPAVVAPAAKV
jgi:large subunit ribosomal protein LP0